MIPKIGCRLKGDIFASITERPRSVTYTYKYEVIKEGYKHTKQTKTKRTKNKQTKNLLQKVGRRQNDEYVQRCMYAHLTF